MKYHVAFRYLFLVLVLAHFGRAIAQIEDAPVGVAVAIKGVNLGFFHGGNVTFGMTALNGSVGAFASQANPTMDQFIARMEPGKTYFLSVSGSSFSGRFQAVPPPGYTMEIERIEREKYLIPSNGNYRLRVLAPFQTLSARAGTATPLMSGRVYWQLALGSLANGANAGALTIIDAGTNSNWSSLFSVSGFTFEPLSSQVKVFYNPTNPGAPYIAGTIRQIITPEALVDVYPASSTETVVKVFHRDQTTGTSGLRGLTGSPFAVYTITQNSSTKVTIKCELTDQANLSAPNAAVKVTKYTVLERSGSAPNFTFKADDWYEGGASVSRETRARSSGVETYDVSVPSGATALQGSRSYTSVPWGEELTQEVAGSSNSITTTTEYYVTNAQAGNYGRVKSISTTGGSWEAYEYYDHAGGTADQAGALWKKHRPFKDSDTSVPANLGAHHGEVTMYDYALDQFGRRTRPTLVETAVDGVVTAKTTTAYADSGAGISGHSNLNIVTATRNDYRSSSESVQTITKYFREDVGTQPDGNPNDDTPLPDTEDFFRMQIHSEQLPGNIKRSYAYQRGTWSGGGSFTLSGNAGADYGEASIISVITGKSDTGTPYASHGTYNIDDLFVVTDQSTLQTTIRDKYARVRRTESYIWHGGTWSLVSSADFSYDGANLLVSRGQSNGATYSSEYEGDHLKTETDEAGVVTTYESYDGAGRVQVARREASGGIAELKTKYTYDAADRMTEIKIGEGQSETLVSSQTFDDAGRPTGKTPAGLGTTSITYSPANRTRTVTPPIGGARTETLYADGQVASVTGPGVVEEFYNYEIQSLGLRYAKVSVGGSSSPRKRELWSDWLGRPTKTSVPGWPGQPAFEEINSYESGTGRLIETSRTGYATTKYGYDSFGRVNRVGLDVQSGTLVENSSDRITDSEQVFELIGTDWWLKQQIKTYPYANGNAVTLSISRKRLSGFSAGILDETQVTDAEGNTAISTTTVNRTARTATVTTARPGYNNAVEYSTNGLSTSVLRTDGLTFSTTYDSLLRQKTVVDPRTGVTTTNYWSSSLLPSSVSSAAGTLYSAEYDALGRRKVLGDPAGKNTRFQYNDRGQLLRQWGNGAYPVEYGYDPLYGDRTSLSTYRAASAGDSTSWPSVGSADTTTFEYDVGTGLLYKRMDAANKFVEFSYNARGQTYQRFWSRTYGGARVTSTYDYDGNTGELRGITYNDSTPAVSYEYTRMGQLYRIQDYTTGSSEYRTFAYDSAKPWRQQSLSLPGFYGGRVMTSLYEGTGDVGRARGFQLGASLGSTADLEQIYALTTGGRLDTIASNRASNTVSRTFRYAYKTNSALVETLSIDGHSFSVTRDYQSTSDLLSYVDSKWSGVSRTRYDYTYDNRYKRESAKQSGDAYGDYGASTFARYTYNDRGELIAAPSYLGSNVADLSQPLPGRQNAYDYDSIGNRKWSNRTGSGVLKESFFGDAGGTQEGGNALNQLMSRENDSLPVQGTVDAAGTTVAVGGVSSEVSRQGRYWATERTVSNSSAPWFGTVEVAAAKVGGGSGGADLIRVETRNGFLGKALQVFSYDDDGNLKSDGIWDYQWDAENRLVSAVTNSVALAAGYPNKAIEFRYDYMGRRVMKRDVNVSGSERRYLYSGWNVLAELDTSTAIKRSFTWGLDSAGSLTATGGVGALLQIRDEAQNKTLLPTYDGNGNVASLVNADTGWLEAAYEYDPSGNLLRCEGSYAKENPFRFSTKWSDDETGLIYYGYRYYSPSIGRFVNRDPIAEKGGINLYGFCGNDSINGSDRLGLIAQIVLDKFVVAGGKVGSSFGPIGTLVGSVVGGGLGLIATKIFGFGGGAKAAKVKPKSTAQDSSTGFKPEYTWKDGMYGYYRDGQWVDMSWYYNDPDLWVLPKMSINVTRETIQAVSPFHRFLFSKPIQGVLGFLSAANDAGKGFVSTWVNPTSLVPGLLKYGPGLFVKGFIDDADQSRRMGAFGAGRGVFAITSMLAPAFLSEGALVKGATFAESGAADALSLESQYPRYTYSQRFKNSLWDHHAGPDGKVFDPSGMEIKPGEYWEVGHAGDPYSMRIQKAFERGMSIDEWWAQEHDLRLFRPERQYTNRSNLFQDWKSPTEPSIFGL